MRIVGELRKLGYYVSAQTVRRYRRKATRRPPSQSWRTFLRNHAPHIWAADFFTVQTLTLKTLYVFLFISHGRRWLVHLNVTAHPNAEWVWRQLIEATPWRQQPKYLLRDRDCCYGGSFSLGAAGLGIAATVTPVRAPKANAIAERVIGTLRRECLDHLIIINERHLQSVLREYVAYYNSGRSHRTLDLETPWGRLLGLPRRWLAGSLPIQCWVAYTTSTNGWLHDLSRYGCDFGTPQCSGSGARPHRQFGSTRSIGYGKLYDAGDPVTVRPRMLHHPTPGSPPLSCRAKPHSKSVCRLTDDGTACAQNHNLEGFETKEVSCFN
jgi:transposase InsO family protein